MAANPTTTIDQLRANVAPRVDQLPQVRAGFTDLQGFELAQRGAKALAASTLVPKDFQGNLPNCLIALELAQRIGASPLLVMQNLYIVHGRPGWSAKFLIATFNQCGRFSALRYEWKGGPGSDDWGCRAWAIEKSTGERIEGAWITWKMVKAEGWNSKNGSKWQTIPEQMFMYRAAAWLVNTHAPEISMGLSSEDDLRDTFDAAPGPDGAYTVTAESLAAAEPKVETASAPPEGGADAVPHFSPETAVAALRSARTTKALKATWKSICDDFTATRRELPIDIEATFHECEEAIRQGEAG